MGGKRMDTIGQSGEGWIRCHGYDSIPLLGQAHEATMQFPH